MFRLESNVPEVYVDTSRDFQLLCRLYDVCFNSTRFSIDSMQHLTSAAECDIQVLELLKTKLGLFSNFYATETELRFLLSAFPTLIRYKGSKQGVEYITLLYARMYPGVVAPKYVYDTQNHVLELIFSEVPQNSDMLRELLKYILPAGYALSLRVSKHRDMKNYLYTEDKLVYVNADATNKFEYNQIGGVNDIKNKEDPSEFHFGPTVGLSMIINPTAEE